MTLIQQHHAGPGRQRLGQTQYITSSSQKGEGQGGGEIPVLPDTTPTPPFPCPGGEIVMMEPLGNLHKLIISQVADFRFISEGLA